MWLISNEILKICLSVEHPHAVHRKCANHFRKARVALKITKKRKTKPEIHRAYGGLSTHDNTFQQIWGVGTKTRPTRGTKGGGGAKGIEI